VTFRGPNCHTDFLNAMQQGTGLRSLCVALLCLSYLVTNTGMVSSIQTQSGCHCAEDLKSNSRCCCFNKSRSTTNQGSPSCCAARKPAGHGCCSAHKRASKQSQQTESESPQISRICGCGHSQHKGWFVTDPRQLNSAPQIITNLNRSQLLLVADDSSTCLAIQPEIPPPRLRTR
jgi:hypothetical protein